MTGWKATLSAVEDGDLVETLAFLIRSLSGLVRDGLIKIPLNEKVLSLGALRKMRLVKNDEGSTILISRGLPLTTRPMRYTQTG